MATTILLLGCTEEIDTSARYIKTYYLKMKSVLDTETAEFYMDHIEYSPKGIYDNPEHPEDIW